ncbi:reductive dehalogenase [Dehalogenimonas formicexedens]|uniref:Reductive dehalogenase n=1 Tax=Dehalogenimonas formicexedens TaxID=1839801 RepID=A0A1P8F5M7_9CHLR|nr:reductive dehalogenase [Dehalogenimonas formicexedens]APV43784.1 reductive dehalogenase [Dehalogenimonas formicexedens]
MSINHSTVSRRDFMKGLGLAGGGIGTLAVAGPTFSDLDELLSESTAGNKRDWWIKDQDEPTVEIDWSMMQRHDATKIPQVSYANYVGKDVANAKGAKQKEDRKQWILENKSGYTLKDYALFDAAAYGWQVGFSHDFFGDTTVTPYGMGKPGDLGVPIWQGSPEENSAIIRKAFRFLGAGTVSVVELNDNHRKLIDGVDWDGKNIVFEEVETASETTTKRVIPNKCKWAIVFSLPMSEEMNKRAPTLLGDATTALSYSLSTLFQIRAQRFVRMLGYQGLGSYQFVNNVSINPALAVVSGLGEQGRLGQCIMPEYGTMARLGSIITDLPLSPDKPIDAGIWRFCQTCKLCATHCPSGALNPDDTLSWDRKYEGNHPGKKAFLCDGIKCRTYWFESTSLCSICVATCVFAKKDKAGIHEVVKATVATTPIFNTIFKNMDQAFGYNYANRDPESWWDLKTQPMFGFNSNI